MKNCQFCNKPLSFLFNESFERIPPDDENILDATVEMCEANVYECMNCPIYLVYYYYGDELIKNVFVLDKSKKTYLWTNNYMTNTSSIYLADVKDADKYEPLLLLNQVVPLTPENIMNKFSLYVIFS